MIGWLLDRPLVVCGLLTVAAFVTVVVAVEGERIVAARRVRRRRAGRGGWLR